MPSGRPSSYNETVQAKADAYVNDYLGYGHPIPSVERLAKHLGISRETCYAWARDPDKSAFSDTLERLKDEQKAVTLEKGLLGEYNATIAKLILSANHGMHERQDRGLSGPDGGPVQIQEVRRTIVDPQHSDS